MEKLPSIHEERFLRIEQAIVHLAGVVEAGAWRGIMSDIQEMLSTPVSEKEDSKCFPHELIGYQAVGALGGSVTLPNKICRKCLLTMHI